MLMTLRWCRDMHKAQNMSHAKITIPITVNYRRYRGSLRFVSREESKRIESRDSLSPSPFKPLDPWALRDEFLAWPLDEWEAFIAKAGSFDPLRVNKKGFRQWQELLREALLHPAREWEAWGHNARLWLSAQPRLFFDWESEPPQAIIFAQSPLEAMIATIQVDKLTGAEFRVCARHDCKNPPFRVEARQKIFCSMDCAHLVAVRRSRERSKTGKRKTHKGKP